MYKKRLWKLQVKRPKIIHCVKLILNFERVVRFNEMYFIANESLNSKCNRKISRKEYLEKKNPWHKYNQTNNAFRFLFACTKCCICVVARNAHAIKKSKCYIKTTHLD